MLAAHRDGTRDAAEVLVDPDLAHRPGSLVDLGDGRAVEDEHRGLALGPHRLDQRLHDPGSGRRRQLGVALDHRAQARVGRVLDDDHAAATGADPWLDHGGAERGDRFA